MHDEQVRHSEAVSLQAAWLVRITAVRTARLSKEKRKLRSLTHILSATDCNVQSICGFYRHIEWRFMLLCVRQRDRQSINVLPERCSVYKANSHFTAQIQGKRLPCIVYIPGYRRTLFPMSVSGFEPKSVTFFVQCVIPGIVAFTRQRVALYS